MFTEDPVSDEELTPVPRESDGGAKLNELLAVLSLMAFLWNLFRGGR